MGVVIGCFCKAMVIPIFCILSGCKCPRLFSEQCEYEKEPNTEVNSETNSNPVIERLSEAGLKPETFADGGYELPQIKCSRQEKKLVIRGNSVDW